MADLLDKWGVFRSRLFRESCVFYRGNYVKDLERLGRDLRRVAIVDNSPASYIFHPENAVRVRMIGQLSCLGGVLSDGLLCWERLCWCVKFSCVVMQFVTLPFRIVCQVLCVCVK